MTITIKPIPCLTDNYAWWLRDPATGQTAVVDPGEAGPVAAMIRAEGTGLDWILLTHHHGDHIDGVAALVTEFGAKVVGASADARRLPPLDLALAPGDSFTLGQNFGTVLDSPGHTLGHIAFAFRAAVFCGDTLFSAGCGRLLEGTPADMFGALAALAALPDETLVCCGHEYTLNNIRFALTLEPDNAALREWSTQAQALRDAGRPTLPTTIGFERQVNPFLRAKSVAELARIRAAKDVFR